MTIRTGFGLGVLAAVLGCNPTAGAPSSKKADENPANPAKSPATQPAESDQGPRAWLDRMAAAYRKAQSYSDEGELTFVVRGFDARSQPTEERQTFPFSVSLIRPNQIRLAAYQGLVVCDGSKVRGKIINRDNSDFDGQIVELAAPAEFSSETLATWNSAMLGVLLEGIAGPPPQLPFLTDSRAIENLAGPHSRLALLAPQEINGRACRGVQFEDDAGRSVLWIDEKTHELVRLQFPVAALAAQMGVDPGQLTLVADFHQARLGAPVSSDRFNLDLPPQPKIVKYLVLPPPAAPLELLGRPLPDITLTASDGTRVSREQLAGKTAILCFFSLDDRARACEAALGHLHRMWQESIKSKGNARVFAVSTDPTSVSIERINQQIRQQAGDIPVLRAAERRGDNALVLTSMPTTLLVDPHGKVQDVLPGYNLEVFNEIPRRIETIAAGQDFYRQVQKQFDDDDQRYRQLLDLAERGGVAKKSDPSRLRMTQRWHCRDVREPGNLAIVADGTQKLRIYAIEAFRRIIELDSNGIVVARHDPKLPPDARISYLRAARDGQGRLWLAASAPGQPQLVLLDERFQVQLRHPARQAVAIGDVQLVDVEGDGTLELVVGYLGVNGVHLVALDGNRKWRNPSVENVSRLAVIGRPGGSAAGRQILAATYSGRVTPIDVHGADAAKWQPDAGAIHQVLAADGLLCAVAATPDGGFVAAGIKPDGTSLWELPLPIGRSTQPVEPIAWGQLSGDRPHWIVASADASIHFIAQDGKIIDQFSYGAQLGGIAVLRDADGRDLLIVASENGIEALRFE